MEQYRATELSEDMSVLELLDQVNEGLLAEGKSPIVFDHDCREGICGSCSMVINGVAHGPERAATTCQTSVDDALSNAQERASEIIGG